MDFLLLLLAVLVCTLIYFIYNGQTDRKTEQAVLRVVLLGKTGAGKSSLGNTLLGRDIFQVQKGMVSGTEKCQWAEEKRYGLRLQVVDTPGLCDTYLKENQVCAEVAKSVALAVPGPHVIVLVLRCDKRFTEEEYAAYLTLKGLFGDNVCHFMIVVFTGVDAYGATREEQREKFKMESVNFPPRLKQITCDTSDRLLTVNNLSSPRDRDRQGKELVAAMTGLVERNGGCYFTSELTEEIDKLKQPLIQKRKIKSKCTMDEAQYQTNNAIVLNEEDSKFMEKITGVIRRILFRVLTLIRQNSADKKRGDSTEPCSLM